MKRQDIIRQKTKKKKKKEFKWCLRKINLSKYEPNPRREGLIMCTLE